MKLKKCGNGTTNMILVAQGYVISIKQENKMFYQIAFWSAISFAVGAVLASILWLWAVTLLIRDKRLYWKEDLPLDK
jgi:membrane protein YdbS with pleckstrin-like domain